MHLRFSASSHSHRGSRETVANDAAFAVVLQSQLWSLKSSRLCLARHLRHCASSKRRQGTRRPPPAQIRKTQEYGTTLRGYRAPLFHSLRIPWSGVVRFEFGWATRYLQKELLSVWGSVYPLYVLQVRADLFTLIFGIFNIWYYFHSVCGNIFIQYTF